MIFLIIAIAVLSSLIALSLREQAYSSELSQAQLVSSLKQKENLKVIVAQTANGNQDLIVTNKGATSSYLVELIVAKYTTQNGQEVSQAVVYVLPLNIVVPAGQTVYLKGALKNLPSQYLNTNVYTYAILTAYGNVFWANQGGG